MVAGRDRSLELYQIFDRLKAQGSGSDRRRPARTSGSSDQVATSRFYDAAQRFSKELSATSGMIGNFAKLMQNQTVFEDQATEIASLTTIVKQRLSKLHDDLGALAVIKDEAISSQGRMTQQAERHSETVVNTLRSKLLNASQGFKGVLQQRTKTLKEDCSRRNQFSSDRSTTFESALFQRAAHETEPLVAADGSGFGHAQDLSLVAPSNVNYYRQRHDAVREVEAAVMQIGEMFQDFHRMVHEQEELVIRIDTDVDHAVTHVDGGISQLLQHLQSLSSNRGLILKIFAVLFFFILFFGFFVVR